MDAATVDRNAPVARETSLDLLAPNLKQGKIKAITIALEFD